MLVYSKIYTIFLILVTQVRTCTSSSILAESMKDKPKIPLKSTLAYALTILSLCSPDLHQGPHAHNTCWEVTYWILRDLYLVSFAKGVACKISEWPESWKECCTVQWTEKVDFMQVSGVGTIVAIAALATTLFTFYKIRMDACCPPRDLIHIHTQSFSRVTS